MRGIVSEAQNEFDKIRIEKQSRSLTTGDVRKASARLFKGLNDKSKENVFARCGELLDAGLHCVAFDFAHRMKNFYDDDTFFIFEGWLAKYVRGWGDCDDFCVHAFGELIHQKPRLFEQIIPWTKREEFWMRRASAVVLNYTIQKGGSKKISPLAISDLLMNDEHYLVLKGYGWMLKILSTKEPKLVFDYLLKNENKMPRLAYRYALGKFDAETKKALMKK